MPEVALRRRRGTKKRSRGWFRGPRGLQIVLICVPVVGFVFLVGSGIGFLGASDESDGTNNLRAGSISTGQLNEGGRRLESPPKRQVGSENPNLEGKSLEERKRLFLAHTPNIATRGSFPYYPEGARLVPTDHDFTMFEAPGGGRFKEWKFGDSPYEYQPGESDDLARSRRYHVKNAMKFAWSAYETYAFGMDELMPQSKDGSDGWGGMGNTLVDSLDTLWLMDMKDEFRRARDWVASSLDYDRNKMAGVFETTIRSLGGLLSAYDWSGDEIFLEKAHDLGKRLFPAVSTSPSGLPYGEVNLHTGVAKNVNWMRGVVVTAEFATIQIEFRMLARLTGNHEFKEKTERIFEIMRELRPTNGLYPYRVSNDKMPRFLNKQLTFGANSDSFYEYMLKMWLQGGRTEDLYRSMYDDAIQGMHDELLQVSSPSGLVFIADKNNGRLDTKMDHLVCFMGGLLAIGAYTDPTGLDSERAQRDLQSAKALTYTCYQMYARMPTGISPEFVQFNERRDLESGNGAPHYLLRPEAVESFFVLYHLTGDPVYREWGWEVFQAIERYCKTSAGYGQLHDVRDLTAKPEDKMESFFLAETLKYLYLLFDPDTPIDLLNKHVFNTEAHPVRIFPAMDNAGVKNLLKAA